MTLNAFTNTFAGNPLDRASYRRADEAWIAEQLANPQSLAIALWNGKPLVETAKDGGVQIAYLAADMARVLSAGPERLLFLGLWKDTAMFALDAEGDADPADGPLEGLGRFEDLRAIAMTLPGTEAGIIATAKSMFEWRRRHRHCANCGQDRGDRGRLEADLSGMQERAFPAHRSGGDHAGDQGRALPAGAPGGLAQGRCTRPWRASWSPARCIEEACARELFEEAGLRAPRVRYHSTQPWPYPVLPDDRPDRRGRDRRRHPRPDVEIDEVRWFTREETPGHASRRTHRRQGARPGWPSPIS